MRRWRERWESARTAEANARAAALMGFALVDYIHDNRTAKAYHQACAAALGLIGDRGVVELGGLPGEYTCAHCQRAIE